MRRTLVSLAGLLALSAPTAAHAVPDRDAVAAEVPVRTLHPLRLPRGADAALDHLQDGVIRTASGRTLRVRVPSGDDQVALLGRSGGAWLVAWGTGAGPAGHRFHVVRVRRGHAPVEVPRQRVTSYGEDFHGWRLDRDGTRLVSTTYDRGGTGATVRDVATGHRIDTRFSGGFFTPFDVADGHVATFAESELGRLRVVDWQPGVGETTIARRVAHVDLRRDLAFVRVSGRDFGPTSVAAPGEPAWAAPFAPLDVSPDGALAVGLRISRSGFDDRGVLEVRAMDDGRLLDALSLGDHITMDTWSITTSHEQTVRWEDDSHYVVQLPVGRDAVLVRCRVGGRCERASDVGGDVSTPYEYFMWPR
ncbi:hypothetical protein [Nocardioides okcheonensis]|uniref:hypothetical protein n=1 Tax=Nocardioides okcheonensis TaxID=2894081 RepID=UPI001E5B141B|nr:hypothetical protein [Nocardioides okcheonensis]UFN44443.1 hypothetical protein LN652_20740 [Nocardioides okcheonensis]